MAEELKVFVSYSPFDIDIKDQFVEWLKPHEGFEILPKTTGDLNMGEQISQSEVFLLLVSADYLQSDFTRNTILPQIMKKAEENTAYVIPIILESCKWQKEAFAIYQPIIGVSTSPRSAAAITELSTEIKDILLSISELKANPAALKKIAEIRKGGLTTLDLSSCQLRRIPRDLLNMFELERLFLDRNKISNIENLENLQRLEYLSLAENKIAKITNLYSLKNLKFLDLAGNQLTDVKGLKRNIKLGSLGLTGNKISSLSGIEHLSNLTALYLSYNKLKTVDELEKLPGLKKIVLANNEIESIKPLRKHIIHGLNVAYTIDHEHEGIYAGDNLTLSEPPIEVVQQGRDAVLKYFGDADIYGTKKLEIFKLILVGNSKVGKTNLSEFIREMPLTEKHNSTHVLEITQWDAPFLKSESGTLTRMNIFDFGGQDYYHDSHRIYYSHDTAYILVWDTTTNKYSEEKEGADDMVYENFPLEYWLESISYNLSSKYRHTYNGNEKENTNNTAPVLVLQNKIDIAEGRLNEKELADKYKNIACFFNVSLQKGKRTKLLTEVLGDYLYALNLSGRQLILYEHKIIEHYLPGKREFQLMSIDEFHQECIGIINSELIDFNLDNARIIAEILTATGIMFYDARLGNNGAIFTQIAPLNDIIKNIMQIAKTGNDKGIFSIEQVAKIPHKDEVLQLLVNNNSIIRLNDTEFLAPQFLPLRPEPSIDFFLPAFTHTQLRFIYTAYFHKSILLSLFSKYLTDKVSRSNPGIRSYPFWRNGIFISRTEGQSREMVFVEFLKTEQEGIISIKTLLPFNKRGLEKEIEETLDKLNASWTVTKEISVNSKDFFDVEYLQKEAAQSRFEFTRNGSTFSINDFKHIIDFDNLPKRIFISYSSKDASFMKRFATHLEVLKQAGTIDPWYDRMIESGAKWDDTIRNEIKNADVIVFLLSPDFLATEYIMKTELPMALEQVKNDASKLFFVELKPCGWERTQIKDHQQTDDPANPEKNIVSIGTFDNDAKWKVVINRLEAKFT